MLIGRKLVFLDIDWLRIGTPEMVKYEIMVLACQVGLFHLKLTQINSEMNCIAKYKCSLSQKLDTRRRGEKLNATSHVVICVFALFFVIQENCQKI